MRMQNTAQPVTQKRFMRKAEIGTKVYYAGMRWMVLDKALLGEKAMLIRSTPLSKEELPSGKEGENLKGKKLTRVPQWKIYQC